MHHFSLCPQYRFIAGSPSCVDFDEKLLYYHTVRRLLGARPNRVNFACIGLELAPLKVGATEFSNCLINPLKISIISLSLAFCLTWMTGQLPWADSWSRLDKRDW